MSDHKFQKADGSKGRPKKTDLCKVCSVVYTDHPKKDPNDQAEEAEQAPTNGADPDNVPW